MRSLVCTNENHEVTSVHISTNANTLNELMRREYQNELVSLEDEGYDVDEIDCDFSEGSSAYIEVSEDYAYYWQIESCTEV